MRVHGTARDAYSDGELSGSLSYSIGDHTMAGTPRDPEAGGMMGEAIYRIHKGLSVGEMFN